MNNCSAETHPCPVDSTTKEQLVLIATQNISLALEIAIPIVLVTVVIVSVTLVFVIKKRLKKSSESASQDKTAKVSKTEDYINKCFDELDSNDHIYDAIGDENDCRLTNPIDDLIADTQINFEIPKSFTKSSENHKKELYLAIKNELEDVLKSKSRFKLKN